MFCGLRVVFTFFSGLCAPPPPPPPVLLLFPPPPQQAENESIGRVRFNLIERMIQPCGPPPQGAEEGGEDGGEQEAPEDDKA